MSSSKPKLFVEDLNWLRSVAEGYRVFSNPKWAAQRLIEVLNSTGLIVVTNGGTQLPGPHPIFDEELRRQARAHARTRLNEEEVDRLKKALDEDKLRATIPSLLETKYRQAIAAMDDVLKRLIALKGEVNCRREHGAECPHLAFIEKRIGEIIDAKGPTLDAEMREMNPHKVPPKVASPQREWRRPAKQGKVPEELWLAMRSRDNPRTFKIGMFVRGEGYPDGVDRGDMWEIPAADWETASMLPHVPGSVGWIQEEFTRAVKPLVAFMQNPVACHPHMCAIVDAQGSSLLENQLSMPFPFLQATAPKFNKMNGGNDATRPTV